MNAKDNYFSTICWLSIVNVINYLRLNNDGYNFDYETLLFFNDEIDFYIGTEALI